MKCEAVDCIYEYIAQVGVQWRILVKDESHKSTELF
jgi:hypothetical protein